MVRSTPPGTQCVRRSEVSCVLSLTGQMVAFFMTVLTGICVGLAFDLYRAFRSAVGPARWVSALCDLLYWILVTPVVFVLLLAANWAELRYYVAIGMALGLFVYFQLLSAFVVWFLTGLRHGIGAFFSGIGRMLLAFALWPFRLAGGIGFRPGSSFLNRPGRRSRPRVPRMRWRGWHPGRLFRT